MSASPLFFRRVDKTNSADFEALFDAPGGPKYCWCMALRATPDEARTNRSAQGRSQILGRVASGVPIGLLGYRDGVATAWVSIAPKESFRGLGEPTAYPGQSIWSLTCMYIPRRERGAGLAHQLIAGAIDEARRQGAKIVEAYPVDPDAPSFRHMGFVAAFDRAGFTHVGLLGRRRHVVRLFIGQ
jgi:predicted GNAT family acetyltransferase